MTGGSGTVPAGEAVGDAVGASLGTAVDGSPREGGGPDAEPTIDLDTMLDLTASARAGDTKFDGVDLFLFDPHVSIDASNDDLQRLADKVRAKNLMVGSLVAPVWPPTGGGSAMGDEEDRKKFLTQVEKACGIGRTSMPATTPPVVLL